MKRFADFVGMQNHLLIFTLSCALLVISEIQFKYQFMTVRCACNEVAAAPKTKRHENTET
jgi:hypothetical protein